MTTAATGEQQEDGHEEGVINKYFSLRTEINKGDVIQDDAFIF